MQVNVTESMPVTVVALRGELDIATVGQVRAMLYDLVGRPPGKVVLDLTGLTFCGCAGAHMFVSLQRRVDDNGRLVLAGCRRQVRRVLDVSGVRPLFDLADTVAAAKNYVAGTVLC